MNVKYISMLLMIVCASINTGCVGSDSNHTSNTQNKEPQQSIGIDLNSMDRSINPQDNFYMYANGNWDKQTQIPADKSVWTTMHQLRQQALENQYTIIKQILSEPHSTTTNNNYKLAQMFLDYMDEEQLNRLGITPIMTILQQINQVGSSPELAAMMGNLVALNINTPLALIIGKDAKSTKVIANLEQNGLGLPDRDYYLVTDDPTLIEIRNAYKAHIGKVFSLAGLDITNSEINDIYQLEENIARIQLEQSELRNPSQQYHHYTLEKLTTEFTDFAWESYFNSANLNGKITELNINEPQYVAALMPLFKNTSLNTWKNYLRFHTIENFAPYLTHQFSTEYFDFNQKILLGIQQQPPRWQNAIALLNNTLGDALGELYVKEYFNSQNKEKITALVKNLITTYGTSIQQSDWMSPQTKLKALEKLAKLNVKVGYPNQWQDYSKIMIKAGSLVENIIAINKFIYLQQINKLNKDVDRQEWGMTPQTVNAYYDPQLNEIVFPAAILQPPYFNSHADDAANYGGIGMVIGHEISHGFDDEGSQFDADGNLNNWMSDQDRKMFEHKTATLIEQYNHYMPLNGYHINGKLTLGENIADNSGLKIAYLAYESTLAGKPSPVINGLTGEQRFYISYAQGWKSKSRDNYLINIIKTDPHTPGQIRAYAPLLNQTGFYKAFNIQAGHNMYIAPENRADIW
ncbi:MAG: M13 family peptidase [Proteobacteria bacterium]|nr:MAG: M13 family peptidase [Pseudomonadota bacterium]